MVISCVSRSVQIVSVFTKIPLSKIVSEEKIDETIVCIRCVSSSLSSRQPKKTVPGTVREAVSYYPSNPDATKTPLLFSLMSRLAPIKYRTTSYGKFSLVTSPCCSTVRSIHSSTADREARRSESLNEYDFDQPRGVCKCQKKLK